MFFPCKVCEEKERRIAELKDQVTFLRTLAAPSNDPDRVPSVHLEADGILSGRNTVIELPDDPQPGAEADKIVSERDRILSGNY